jgi:hypothetical protein
VDPLSHEIMLTLQDYPCKELGTVNPGTDIGLVEDLLNQIGDILDGATKDLGGMKDKYNSHNGLLGGLLGNKQLDKVYVFSSTLIYRRSG